MVRRLIRKFQCWRELRRRAARCEVYGHRYKFLYRIREHEYESTTEHWDVYRCGRCKVKRFERRLNPPEPGGTV